MGQNFQSSFHKQVMAEALKAAIDVVATQAGIHGPRLTRAGGVMGFSEDLTKKPEPGGMFMGRYTHLNCTNASVRMNAE
jgi:hypothetical protein